MSYNRPDLDLVDSSFFLAASKIFVGLSESPLAFQFKTLTTQFAILLNGDLITSSSHVFTNFESMSLQKNLISRHVLCFYLNGWKVSYFVRQKPVTPAFLSVLISIEAFYHVENQNQEKIIKISRRFRNRENM